MNGVDFALGPTFEVVIVGPPRAKDTRAMLATVWSHYTPNAVVLLRKPGEDTAIVHLAEFTQPYKQLDGKTTAYVCRDFQCQLPTTDVQTMVALLTT
jgi:uncharacterized protein YyaL (SSP411 family)